MMNFVKRRCMGFGQESQRGMQGAKHALAIRSGRTRWRCVCTLFAHPSVCTLMFGSVHCSSQFISNGVNIQKLGCWEPPATLLVPTSFERLDFGLGSERDWTEGVYIFPWNTKYYCFSFSYSSLATLANVIACQEDLLRFPSPGVEAAYQVSLPHSVMFLVNLLTWFLDFVWTKLAHVTCLSCQWRENQGTGWGIEQMFAEECTRN